MKQEESQAADRQQGATGRAPRRMRGVSRAVGVVALAALTLLATSTAAQAHYVYEKELTYYEDPEMSETPVCTEGRSEVSHGNGGGFSKSTVYSYTKDFDHLIRCGWERDVQAGWIASLETIWKWTGTEWAVCFNTDWRYNTSTQWKTDFSRYWNVPCGPGYYGVIANGYVWDEEFDEWRGGGVWSGYHELAGDGLAATAARAPEAPRWVKDGVVDVKKVPARVASARSGSSLTARSVFGPPPNRPPVRR